MEMDTVILKAIIKQTKASDDSSSSDSSELTLRKLKNKRILQNDNANNQGNMNENNQNENQNEGGDDNQNENTDDDVFTKYIFYEWDNNYFSEQLGFSNTVSEGLSSTYCLNYSCLENQDLNFTLSPLNPLGISSNPLTFSFEQNCQSSQCTTQTLLQYVQRMPIAKQSKLL